MRVKEKKISYEQTFIHSECGKELRLHWNDCNSLGIFGRGLKFYIRHEDLGHTVLAYRSNKKHRDLKIGEMPDQNGYFDVFCVSLFLFLSIYVFLSLQYSRGCVRVCDSAVIYAHPQTVWQLCTAGSLFRGSCTRVLQPSLNIFQYKNYTCFNIIRSYRYFLLCLGGRSYFPRDTEYLNNIARIFRIIHCHENIFARFW